MQILPFSLQIKVTATPNSCKQMETLKMTEKIKLSVAEIADLADKAKKKGINSGLPATRAGVNRRVTKQGWESEDIPTAGGKNGFKKLYTIPSYIIEELKEKGVLDFLRPEKKVVALPKVVNTQREALER